MRFTEAAVIRLYAPEWRAALRMWAACEKCRYSGKIHNVRSELSAILGKLAQKDK